MTKAGVVTPPASVVSSCSSSSGVSSTSSNIKQCLYQNSLSSQASSPIKENSTLTPAQIKAEKIREALEKMKEANIKKVYVKFFLEDNHTISLLIDERWSCVEVMKVIVSKLGISLHPEHCIVEEYPQLRISKFLFIYIFFIIYNRIIFKIIYYYVYLLKHRSNLMHLYMID